MSDEDMVEVTEDTLISQAGMVQFFDVKSSTVSNWVARSHYNGFPAPEPELYLVGKPGGRRMTQVWSLVEVIEWRKTYRAKVGRPPKDEPPEGPRYIAIRKPVVPPAGL